MAGRKGKRRKAADLAAKKMREDSTNTSFTDSDQKINDSEEDESLVLSPKRVFPSLSIESMHSTVSELPHTSQMLSLSALSEHTAEKNNINYGITPIPETQKTTKFTETRFSTFPIEGTTGTSKQSAQRQGIIPKHQNKRNIFPVNSNSDQEYETEYPIGER